MSFSRSNRCARARGRARCSHFRFKMHATSGSSHLACRAEGGFDVPNLSVVDRNEQPPTFQFLCYASAPHPRPEEAAGAAGAAGRTAAALDALTICSLTSADTIP